MCKTYMDYMLWDTEWHCPDYIKNTAGFDKTRVTSL